MHHKTESERLDLQRLIKAGHTVDVVSVDLDDTGGLDIPEGLGRIMRFSNEVSLKKKVLIIKKKVAEKSERNQFVTY